MSFAKRQCRWVILAWLLIGIVSQAHAPQRAGWQAQLSTLFHDVAGRVVIVDDDTLHVEDSTTTVGGPRSISTWAGSTAARPLGRAWLSGHVYRVDDLEIDLPEDVTLSEYTAISAWFNSGLHDSA